MYNSTYSKDNAGRQKLFDLLKQNSVFDDGSDVLQPPVAATSPRVHSGMHFESQEPMPLADLSAIDTFDFQDAPQDTVATLYGFDV